MASQKGYIRFMECKPRSSMSRCPFPRDASEPTPQIAVSPLPLTGAVHSSQRWRQGRRASYLIVSGTLFFYTSTCFFTPTTLIGITQTKIQRARREMPVKIRTLQPVKGKKKQVYFSNINTVYSPPMPVLSPLYTRGLPGPTPYAFPISPPKSTMHLHLHPFLQVSSSPPIIYDLTQPTSMLYSLHYGIPRSALRERATSPPVQTLRIISPRFPWIITVFPSTYHYLTINDVLDGIYRALRAGITHHEFNALPTDRDIRRVSRAYEERYRRIRSQREYQEEKSRGVRRVDFLMEHTKFRGLSPAPGRDTWVLNTT